MLLCVRFENLERIRKKVGQNAAESSLKEIATLLTLDAEFPAHGLGGPDLESRNSPRWP